MAAAPCEHPELWLAVIEPEALAEAYCAACDGCADDEQGEVQMGWPPLHDSDDRLAERYGCAELEYAHRAIAAFHGAPIRDEPWRSYFDEQPWYHVDPHFEPSRLPAAARRNRAWLASVHKACTRRPDHVTAHDRQLVEGWFAQRASGTPPLPQTLVVDDQPATVAAFLEFTSSRDLFYFTPRTPSYYVDGLDGTTRTITVPTGAPGIDCVGFGEECEGFEWLDFTVDERGDLVALEAGAAG